MISLMWCPGSSVCSALEKLKILLNCSHLNTRMGNEQKSSVGLLQLSHQVVKFSV